MSKKGDIVDDFKHGYGLIFSCKCGWIDLGHAREDGVRDNLWNKITNEIGNVSKDGKGYKVTYG